LGLFNKLFGIVTIALVTFPTSVMAAELPIISVVLSNGKLSRCSSSNIIIVDGKPIIGEPYNGYARLTPYAYPHSPSYTWRVECAFYTSEEALFLYTEGAITDYQNLNSRQKREFNNLLKPNPNYR
jgi:hypothetical protein